MNINTRILAGNSKDFIYRLINLCLEENLNNVCSQGCNGDSHLKTFDAQGMTSTVYYYLKKFALNDILPESINAKLKTEYLNNTGRNIFIQTELDLICQAFEARAVPLLVIRGAVFSYQLYPASGMRPLTDIDLVILDKDLKAAQAILKDLGFAWDDDYPYFIHKDEITIDLHLNLAGFWRVSTDNMSIDMRDKSIWSLTQGFKGNQYVRCLGVYDSILASSLHLQWHDFSRLIWFFDIALLIQNQPDFSWDFLFKRARQRNLVKPLFYILSYLKKHELVDISQQIIERIKPKKLNFFENKTLKLLLENKRSNLSGEMLFFYAIPGLNKKLRFLIKGFFLPKGCLAQGSNSLGLFKRIKRLVNILFKVFSKIAGTTR